MSSQVWMWVAFNVFVLVMLAVDLGVLHRHAHEVRLKEALIWSAIWIALALLFALGVYTWYGSQPALEFLTGYLIEKSLSVDNIFVFVLIFSYFKVPARYQHKVLFWGILGALVMRAIFIFAGIALLQRLHWILYVFGALLILTGIKMATEKDKEIHPDKNPVLKLCRRLVAVTEDYHADHFFVKQGGQYAATPLFIVLLVVETTDVIFAVDSIPAILGITTDPFLVYTSNVLAILGLRALYFALAGVIHRFRFLKLGLSAVLVLVGAKMLLADVGAVPVAVALGGIAGGLLVAVLAPVVRPR